MHTGELRRHLSALITGSEEWTCRIWDDGEVNLDDMEHEFVSVRIPRVMVHGIYDYVGGHHVRVLVPKYEIPDALPVPYRRIHSRDGHPDDLAAYYRRLFKHVIRYSSDPLV